MKQNDKLHTVIKKMINYRVLGSDKYVHNDSTWLIFTNEKKWVIELTKEKTLWYNYYFFKKIFDCFKLDVVESQKIITEWVEETIINEVKHTEHGFFRFESTMIDEAIINGVKSTRISHIDNHHLAEDTLQNGVKHTIPQNNKSHEYVEHTIQNGVKHTIDTTHHKNKYVEDTIQNGVKETKGEYYKEIQKVEYTIQYGVKETKLGAPDNMEYFIEDAIQNGVKYTSNRRLVVSKDIDDAIQNGVKRTLQKNINRIGQVEDTIQNGVKDTQYWIFENHPGVEDTIQNGVKHTQSSIFDNPTTVKDTIQNGVKVTYSDKIPHEYDWSNQFTEEIDDIIQNGVKHTEKSLQIDGSCVIEDVIKEGVIEHGIKETKSEVATREWKAGEVINGGVKKTTPGGYLGSVERKGKMVHQFEHSKQDDNVEDVIKSGIKATTTNLPLSQDDGQIAEIEDVIKNGIKKTEAAALFDEELKMDTVISEGIKETIPVVPGDILDTIDFMSYNNTTNVQHLISDVIEKGIKETHDDVMPHTGRVEGVIKNGVKKTVDALSSRLPNPVKDVIKNGVKECIPSRTPLYNPMDFSVQYRENHRLDDVASVLEKGIKEVQPLPAQDGNMDYSNYYYRQGESGKPHTKYVDDVITNGIKETKPMDEWVNTDRIVDGVISNGKIIK